jgi:hypothetical protein
MSNKYYPMHLDVGQSDATPWVIDSPFPPGALPPDERAAWQTVTDLQRAAIAKNLSVFQQLAANLGKHELGFDRAGIEWLDGFLQLVHDRHQVEESKRYVPALGAFYGECLNWALGGNWALYQGNICVRLDIDHATFPLAKVRKQLELGRQGGESVLAWFDELQAQMQSGQPLQLAKPESSATQPADVTMAALLNELRTTFTERQTTLNMRTFGPHWVSAPEWLAQREALREVIDQQYQLHSKGTIVWAALVQSYRLLFSPGAEDGAGILIHSQDAWFDGRPQALRALAREIYELKNNSHRTPAQNAVVRRLTNELDRAMGYQLPADVTDKAVFSTACMVFRKHIPEGVLSSGCVPVLVHPSTKAVMIVPFEFWPPKLVDMWVAGRL